MALGWEVLPHPVYSSDLEPTDFYIFRSLQNFLSNKYFKTAEDVKNCSDKFIRSKDSSFFANSIHALPDKWKNVMDSKGDYFTD